MVIEKDWNLYKSQPVRSSKYLYFITNSNRTSIRVGMTENMVEFAKSFKHTNPLLIEFDLQKERIVYFEEYNDVFEARKRFLHVSKWTRIQKEKLIRNMNPEWTDLTDAIVYESFLIRSKQKNLALRPGFNYN